MIDPMMEFLNGMARPVMFVFSTPYSKIPKEILVEPGDELTVYDQRSKTTAMVRDLTDDEMVAYLKAKEEAEEAKNGK